MTLHWCAAQPDQFAHPAQVDKAFGERLALFDRYRRRFDPGDLWWGRSWPMQIADK